MLKLLHNFFIFIFVIIILNVFENDIITSKLYLKGLISTKKTINKQVVLQCNNMTNSIFVDVIFKKISLNLNKFNEWLLKKNIYFVVTNKCIRNSIAFPNLQEFEDFDDNLIRECSYFNKTNFSTKNPNVVTQLFLLSENLLLQKSINKQAFEFIQNKQNLTIKEFVLKNSQEQNNLVKNLSLNDLIASNNSVNINELLKDNNYKNIENEYSFLNIGKKLKNFPDIKEIKASFDETCVEIPNIEIFTNSQDSITRLENLFKQNNAFLSKMLSENSQLFPFLEKYHEKEKVDKQEENYLKDKGITNELKIVSNIHKNKIIKNLHLKDLITKNEIIRNKKESKKDNCENNKKEHALSYVDNLLKKPPLNINNLIEDVLRRNPDLKATKRRIEANALVVPRVQVLDDPEITAMRHDTPLKSNSSFSSKMRYEASQVFPFPGKLRLKGKIAEQMLKFAQNEEITTMRELVLQTKRLYYQLYLNYAALRINKQNQEIISRFIEDTLALYKTGEEKYDEVLKAQVELQILKKELLNLLSDHDFIVSMINAILDLPQDNMIGKPQGFFTKNVNYKYQELIPIAMKNRSELKGIKSLVSEQYFKAKLARRNYFPDFKISGRYESKLGSKDAAWGAAVSINVPIWIQQKQKKEMREAMKNANAFQNDLKAFEAKIKGRIRDLLSKIESVDEKIYLYETGLVPKTSEALLSGEAVYKTGKGDFLVLLDTIRQFQDFELEYETERAQREIFLAELERAIGVPLEDLTCSTNN